MASSSVFLHLCGKEDGEKIIYQSTYCDGINRRRGNVEAGGDEDENTHKTRARNVAHNKQEPQKPHDAHQ